MIAALVLLAAFGAQTPSQPPQHVQYVARFQEAITAYDAGRFGPAAALFRSAGELAPEAPVWRVHVAVALAASLDQAGDLAEARVVAREALRRGYPPSDLAAIDARLMPDTAVKADLTSGASTVVARLGNVGVLDYGDVSIVGDVSILHVAGWQLNVLHGTAWDLMTGELLATQRTRDTRVVGKVTYSDGRQEDIDFPVEPGRWDHVDGRLLETPTSGREFAGMQIPDSVRTLDSTQMRRGLRTGFWSPSPVEHANAKFLKGDELTLSVAPHRRDSPRPHAFTTVHADTLRIGSLTDDPWLDATLVRDQQQRDTIGEILGEPLKRFDEVHNLVGLPYLLVARYIDLGFPGAPLTVVDYERGAIVARPHVVSRDMFGTDLETFALAKDAGLLFASSSYGCTLEAISTETWSVVWRAAAQPYNPRARRITLRGDRVYSWAGNPDNADVRDILSGRLLFGGTASRFSGLDGSDDGRWAVGVSADSYSLLDGRDFSHVLTMWLEDSDGTALLLTAIGVDGTFSAPEARILDAHIWFAGEFAPAVDVAPWLWDPLHVRNLRLDDDRSPRRIPTAR